MEFISLAGRWLIRISSWYVLIVLIIIELINTWVFKMFKLCSIIVNLLEIIDFINPWTVIVFLLGVNYTILIWELLIRPICSHLLNTHYFHIFICMFIIHIPNMIPILCCCRILIVNTTPPHSLSFLLTILILNRFWFSPIYHSLLVIILFIYFFQVILICFTI